MILNDEDPSGNQQIPSKNSARLIKLFYVKMPKYRKIIDVHYGYIIENFGYFVHKKTVLKKKNIKR